MRKPLTETEIKYSKPKKDGKPDKLSDGGGLFLLVSNKKLGGISRLWRHSFRFDGKQKTDALGSYPEVSLKDARKAHQKNKKKIAKGKDPTVKKVKISKPTFRDLAEEFYSLKYEEWSDTHSDRNRRLLDQYLLPEIGDKVADKISPPMALDALKKMELKGIISSMHKAKTLCSQVFRYGIAKGACSRDPVPDLKGALKTKKSKPFAALITEEGAAGIVRAMEGYHGHYATIYGLRLISRTFVRPNEIRYAQRHEFDLKEGVWTIPDDKMKKRKSHSVPLSKQVIKWLEEVMLITPSDATYLLPSQKSKNRPLSENTLNGAVRIMGYTKEQMTSHGFRSMASTLLNKTGKFNPDAIEVQLSHVEKNQVRAAYNRGKYWEERVEMMQYWSDYLDEIATSDSM